MVVVSLDSPSLVALNHSYRPSLSPLKTQCVQRNGGGAKRNADGSSLLMEFTNYDTIKIDDWLSVPKTIRQITLNKKVFASFCDFFGTNCDSISNVHLLRCAFALTLIPFAGNNDRQCGCTVMLSSEWRGVLWVILSNISWNCKVTRRRKK